MYIILPEYDHDVERHDLEGEFKQNEEAVQDHEVTSDLQNIANFLWVESRACSWCYSVMIAHKKILWILPPGFRTNNVCDSVLPGCAKRVSPAWS